MRRGGPIFPDRGARCGRSSEVSSAPCRTVSCSSTTSIPAVSSIISVPKASSRTVRSFLTSSSWPTTKIGREAPAATRRTTRRPLALVRKPTAAAAEARTPGQLAAPSGSPQTAARTQICHPRFAAIVEADQDHRQELLPSARLQMTVGASSAERHPGQGQHLSRDHGHCLPRQVQQQSAATAPTVTDPMRPEDFSDLR
jgi:hypothetical protein